MTTLTVNTTVIACGENFGVDMSEKKKEIKSILLKAMGIEVPASKTWSRRRIEGVERSKWGNIIRACGITGCQYKTDNPDSVKNHKAVKHGINVVWVLRRKQGWQIIAEPFLSLSVTAVTMRAHKVMKKRNTSIEKLVEEEGFMNGTTTTTTTTTTSSGPLEESGEYQKAWAWTKEEDEALGRGRLKHGTDWEKIHAIVNETGEGRTLAVRTIETQFLGIEVRFKQCTSTLRIIVRWHLREKT
ncbi:hypothetical protein TL16_g03710 [Triparma laevis f. inornata]|uniref:Myb-like domain-containing protein n=1 Tax=Triparma laevis f. inornata TaxID=1714386 RepID=A0A9W7A5T5_9STRA|nr:hypothetical protein TL16_g03710 [Triparma laevis f. inornata]